MVTLELTVCSLVVALVFGAILCAGRLSRFRILRAAAGLYIELVRSTPVVVLLILVYYSLGQLGILIPGFASAVIALGGFYATLYAEIYRSGIQSVERGQREAAAAVGLGPSITMRKIILPQALMAILPPSTNAATDLIKDTALVIELSVADLMYRAYEAGSVTLLYMDLFILAGLIYFIICFGLSRTARRWEYRVQRSGT